MISRDGRLLCAAAQRYGTLHRRAPADPRIVLRAQFGWAPNQFVEETIFDTGATYAILNAQLAEALELLEAIGDETIRYSTRAGQYTCQLHRVPVRLIASVGHDLDLVLPCLVTEYWSQPTFLGYYGLVDRLAFAVDPSDDTFHFGIAAEAPPSA